METANFQLSVVSSDQLLPSQVVDVEAEWTAVDLKRHLSKIYPGAPPIDSQKLIFAGRILSDDSKLKTVIDQAPISRTVHLVLSPSVASQAKAAMAARKPVGYSNEELEKLKENYLLYLNNYYSNANGEFSDPPFHLQTGDENEVINVEIAIENEAEQQEDNVFQQWARALGFRAALEAPDVRNNEAAGRDAFDLFDFAYAIFRISILVAICITYASWQRLALVAAVGLYFYWRNGAQQDEIRRRRQNNPPFLPPPLEPQQQEQGPSQPPQGEQEPSVSVTTQIGADSRIFHSRVGKIAEALRAAGGTSIRLVCAIFSSLVPELPARVE